VDTSAASQEARVSRERLVIQVSEESAELMPLQTTSLATALREFGCGFAIEHFGMGKAPLRLIEQVPMDYLKFDGSLVHGLSGNEDLQQASVATSAPHKPRRSPRLRLEWTTPIRWRYCGSSAWSSSRATMARVLRRQVREP
jgi:hypothetical protein